MRLLSRLVIVCMSVAVSALYAQSSNATSGNANAGGNTDSNGAAIPNGNSQAVGGAGKKSEAQAILDSLDDPAKAHDLNYTKAKDTGFAFSSPPGVPVVIYFWSSRDKRSIDALAGIRKAATDHGNAKFYGVNLDPGGSSGQRGPDGLALPGLQRSEPDGLKGDIPRRLLVGFVPCVYVFDAAGVLCGVGPPRELPVFLSPPPGN